MTTPALGPAAIACPQCHQPMAALHAEGHYGREVELDLCEPCRLVWFDGFESVNLSGPGWIDLLENLHGADASVQAWAGRELGCPRCRTTLQPVRNLTRYGRFVAQECPQRHGCLQSHALLLAERGLVRPPTPRERRAAASERGRWSCLNCGAPVPGDGDGDDSDDSDDSDDCGYCGSPLLMFDLPRLADALLPEAAGRPTVQGAGRALSWPCHGCGAALDPTETTECAQCGHVVVAPTLHDLAPLLLALRQEWAAWHEARAAARRPRR